MKIASSFNWLMGKQRNGSTELQRDTDPPIREEIIIFRLEGDKSLVIKNKKATAATPRFLGGFLQNMFYIWAHLVRIFRHINKAVSVSAAYEMVIHHTR